MTLAVPVRLGPRTYEVRIGERLIAAAGAHLRDLDAGRLFVVADETAWRLHGAALTAGLRASGLAAAAVVKIPPGEASKSFAGFQALCERLLAERLERDDLILAFGGGVIGDLAGFAAAVIKRGVDFVQIPTTLLSQADSSVGGKTAIDTAAGKNLIGAFHQPRRVLADIGVLASLPARELACGFAEILKIALALDFDFFAWLEANGAGGQAGEPATLAEAVRRAVALKASIVEMDERETTGGPRAVLNLGHTFGHALEAATGFGEALKHGEAVGLGCVLAFRFSARVGLCPIGDAERAEAAIAAAGLPTRPPAGLNVEALIDPMRQDKKAREGRLTLILTRGIGEAFVARDCDPTEVRGFLASESTAS